MPEPERLGRYEIVAPLRAGGMARVDVARLRGPYDFCRYVVIKRPLPHQATDPVALEQFRVESRLLASLHHPSVVSFLEAGTDGRGVDYLALEYVHGVSLRDLAPPRGAVLARRPSLDATLAIMKELAAALHHVHEHTGVDGAALGVVHRDVSPSNVLLGYDGSVKLIDFGVAKLTDGATVSGALRGKVSYMAPEQCKGEPIDRRADIYAVGVMLYELATGHRPFYAADEVASLHKVIVGTFAPPHASDPTIDPQLAAIIGRAMAYDAAQRYPTAAALVADLDAFAAARALQLRGSLIRTELARLGEITAEPWRGVAVPPVVQAVSAPRRRRWPAIALVAAAVTATAIVGFASVAGDREDTARTATPAPVADPRRAPAPSSAPVMSSAPAPSSAPVTPSAPSEAGSAVADVASAPPEPSKIDRSAERRAKRREARPAPAAAPPQVPVAPVESPAKPEPPRREAPKVWDPKAFDPVERKDGAR